MTPQAFSYGVVGNDGYIYLMPYGLNESLDYIIKLDPYTFKTKRIKINVTDCTEKYMTAVAIDSRIFFIPYNETNVMILDTLSGKVEYLGNLIPGQGKYNHCHVHGNKIIALPYGEHEPYDYTLVIDIDTLSISQTKIECEINDTKKWHTTQILNDIIYGLPRGENWSKPYFPYRIEFNCNNSDYKLIDMSDVWREIDLEPKSNKKYTTMAKSNNKLYSPPYSENPNFDLLTMFDGTTWKHSHTGEKSTSRKYYSHVTGSNGKIFFPPAGHDENWSEMLIINSNDDRYYTINLGLGKESKKYFAGCEFNEKIYFIPRGGCVCDPEENWKMYGDLAEILVIDIDTEHSYSIDISEYFTDNTTIEKYNQIIQYKNLMFALPYGESDSFQTLLVFDMNTEKVIKTIDLNYV
jgi:hypothetical protein